MKKTALKISLYFSLLLFILFQIWWLLNILSKYFYYKWQEIIKIEKLTTTWYWEEIDNIFNTLEIYSNKNFSEKKYSKENLYFDIFYFLWIWLIFFIFTFFISYKIISRKLFYLEQNLDDMNDFIDNASHELKTPLAIIDSSLWIMKEKKIFDMNLISKSQDEILGIIKLIETLRDLSNITTISKKQKINIWNEIKNISSKYFDKIKEKNINITFEIIENFELEINKNYFYMMFSNILSNSIKYNKNNWEIKIFTINKSLIIQDTWIWIPKDKLTKIFNRFYRVKSHRDREWFWLWLSLVKKICDTYNWQILVISEENIWTKMIIKF